MSSTITETSETRPVHTIFIGNIPNVTGVRDKLVAVVTRLVRGKFGGFSLTVPGENPASARAAKVATRFGFLRFAEWSCYERDCPAAHRCHEVIATLNDLNFNCEGETRRLRAYKNPQSTTMPFRHLSEQRAEERAAQELIQQQRAREDADLRQQQAEVLRQQQQLLQQQQQQQQQQERTDDRLRETVERLDKVVLEHGQTIAFIQAQHDILQHDMSALQERLALAPAAEQIQLNGPDGPKPARPLHSQYRNSLGYRAWVVVLEREGLWPCEHCKKPVRIDSKREHLAACEFASITVRLAHGVCFICQREWADIPDIWILGCRHLMCGTCLNRLAKAEIDEEVNRERWNNEPLVVLPADHIKIVCPFCRHNKDIDYDKRIAPVLLTFD